VALPFSCKLWEPGAGELQLAGERIPVRPNPYSPTCDVTGPVVVLRSVDELRGHRGADEVLVVTGALAADRFFPKRFPFASFPEQLEVIGLLEACAPAAVVAVAPDEGSEPLFEDADLAFPSATVPQSLLGQLTVAQAASLRLGGVVCDADGVNVSGRTSGRGQRVLLSAHVDTKVTTPGAFDNAGGVAALLALAETGITDLGAIELVFFNGEDHYAAPGEQAWLAAYDLDEVGLVVKPRRRGGPGPRHDGRGAELPARARASPGRGARHAQGVGAGPAVVRERPCDLRNAGDSEPGDNDRACA
jgi:aminopeptidase YwaD